MDIDKNALPVNALMISDSGCNFGENVCIDGQGCPLTQELFVNNVLECDSTRESSQ